MSFTITCSNDSQQNEKIGRDFSIIWSIQFNCFWSNGYKQTEILVVSSFTNNLSLSKLSSRWHFENYKKIHHTHTHIHVTHSLAAILVDFESVCEVSNKFQWKVSVSTQQYVSIAASSSAFHSLHTKERIERKFTHKKGWAKGKKIYIYRFYIKPSRESHFLFWIDFDIHQKDLLKRNLSNFKEPNRKIYRYTFSIKVSIYTPTNHREQTNS